MEKPSESESINTFTVLSLHIRRRVGGHYSRPFLVSFSTWMVKGNHDLAPAFWDITYAGPSDQLLMLTHFVTLLHASHTSCRLAYYSTCKRINEKSYRNTRFIVVCLLRSNWIWCDLLCFILTNDKILNGPIQHVWVDQPILRISLAH